MAEQTNNGSAGQGAGDGADDGAQNARPPRIKTPGSGSPPGMYGPHIGSGEVLDIMDELRETYPDARLHLDVIGPDGVKRSAQTFSPTSFDFDQVSRTYGAGEYRVRVQQQGVPKPVKMFRFIAAATNTITPAPAPQPTPQPPQGYYPPPPPWGQPPAHPGAYPPPYAYPPPPQNAPPDFITQIMVENMKAQANTMNMLLTNLTKQTAPDAASVSRMSEFKEILAFTKMLNGGRRGRRDDEDDGDDNSGFIGQLGTAVAKAIVPMLAQQQQPTAPTKPIPRVTPAAPALSVAAATPGVAPQVSPRSDEITVEVTESGASGATAAGDSAPPPPAPTETLDPITAQIVQALRTDANARRIALLVVNDDGQDPDAHLAIGEMSAAALDDEQADAFLKAEAGQWTNFFVLAFPQLAQKRDLMSLVETEMREALQDGVDAGKDDRK